MRYPIFRQACMAMAKHNLESPGFHIEKTSFLKPENISVVDGHHCYPELDPVIRLDFDQWLDSTLIGCGTKAERFVVIDAR